MASSTHKKILITGAPAVGKTTLIRRLVRELDRLHCAGFYTKEIRTGRMRKGFSLVSLDGQQGLLAHVEIDSPCRVGRYGVDVRGFDRFLDAIGSAMADADVVVIDEIGKMEMFSNKFRQLLDVVFASKQQLVATISAAGPKAIQQFKRRAGAALFEVTRDNREYLFKEIAEQVARR